MVIENPSFVVRNLKFRYLFIIGLSLFITLILVLEFFEEPRFGFSRYDYAIMFTMVFVMVSIYRYLMNYNYVNLSVQNGKLSLKYYSLRPFQSNRKNIEIPVQSFLKYELNPGFFKLNPKLYLFQRIQGRVAKYPPVSLSALNNKDITEIRQLLDSVLKTH